jgi:hypothetical protein
MGAVVAHQLGFRGALPPYVAVPRNPSFTWELGKSAYLGGRYESFRTGDPNAAGFQLQDVAPLETVTARSAARRQHLLQAVDGLARQVQGNDQIATYGEFQRRASELVLSSEARSAFAIEQESAALRERYGRARIWDGLGRRLPEFDQGFAALLEDLSGRGLLANTLVAAFGEFGRTPQINREVGRDHWGPAASLLFAGAGVRGGQVIGATDRHGAHVTRRPIAPADVAYTIYEAVGVDPHRWLTHPEGRPIEILDRGEPVRELFE